MLQEIKEWAAPHWLFRLPEEMSHSIALTFDDGPHPDSTPRLLSQLDRLSITATHFLIGSQVAKSGSLTQEIAAAGQVVANHGFRHEGLLFQGMHRQFESIMAADEAIRRYSTHAPQWFRPPFGRFNPSTSKVLRRACYRGALWSLLANDWTAASADELWRMVCSRLHDRAIIVLHDGHPTTRYVIKILSKLNDEVLSRGWKFVALPSSSLIVPS